MLRKKVPKKLWDHALELEALLRSHTALDTFALMGEVPETLMRGQTGNISRLAEHSFYDFVMFYEPKAKYPENKGVLGRWLGPIEEVGPEMTCKILQVNREVIYTADYCTLTGDELKSATIQQAMTEYDAKIVERLGGLLTKDDLEIFQATTPIYESYEFRNSVCGICPTSIPRIPRRLARYLDT